MTIPRNQKELDAIRDECYSMVTKRASLSAGTSAIPVLGADIAADVAILLELIPAINREFGLSDEQIKDYDAATKQIIFQVIKRTGIALVGVEVTKTAIAQIMKKVAGRAVAKQALKFVPFVGWAANAAIGFAAMKYVGNSHVDDCYKVSRRVLEVSEDA